MTGEPTSTNAPIDPIQIETALAGLGEASQSVAQESNTVSPSSPRTETNIAERLTSFADFHHQYVGQYIQLADTKAGASFAITSGATVYLLNSERFADAFMLNASLGASLLAALAFILLNLSSVMSFLVVVPRLPKGGDSLVFWKSVAELSNGAEYTNRISSLSDSSLAAERVSHCYNLSVVCARKYKMLRRAMLIGGLAMVVTFLYWIVLGLHQ